MLASVKLGAFVGIIGSVSAVAALAFLALRPPTFQDVDRRLQKFLTDNRPLACDFKLTYRDVNAGDGKFALSGSRNLYMSFKGLLGNYEFAQDETDAVEVEHARKLYFVSDSYPGRFEPRSRISGAPEVAFPTILLAGSLQRFANGPGKEKLIGREKIGTDSVDHIQFRVLGTQAPTTVDGWVAEDGRLLRFILDVDLPEGKIVTRFDFSNYSRANLQPSRFSVKIPNGYQLDGVRRLMDPIQPGEKVSVSEACVIAVLGNGAPDANIVSALAEIAKSLPVRIVGAVPKNAETLANAKEVLAQLKASDTPLCVLVNKSGVVQRIWVGYDLTERKAFTTDVLAAISKLPKS